MSYETVAQAKEDIDFGERQDRVRELGVSEFMSKLKLNETIRLSTEIINYVNECGSQELRDTIEQIKEEFILNNYVDLRD